MSRFGERLEERGSVGEDLDFDLFLTLDEEEEEDEDAEGEVVDRKLEEKKSIPNWPVMSPTPRIVNCKRETDFQ